MMNHISITGVSPCLPQVASDALKESPSPFWPDMESTLWHASGFDTKQFHNERNWLRDENETSDNQIITYKSRCVISTLCVVSYGSTSMRVRCACRVRFYSTIWAYLQPGVIDHAQDSLAGSRKLSESRYVFLLHVHHLYLVFKGKWCIFGIFITIR